MKFDWELNYINTYKAASMNPNPKGPDPLTKKSRGTFGGCGLGLYRYTDMSITRS